MKSNRHTPRIAVDSREPEHVVACLEHAFGVENVQRGAMRTGDFTFVDHCGHTVGVERKTTSDLLMSFASGRLQEQLNRLLAEFAVPILLIEGHYGLDQELKLKVGKRLTGWSHAAVQMALFSLQGSGVYVLHTPDEDGVADTLRVLYQRGQPPRPKCLVQHDKARVSNLLHIAPGGTKLETVLREEKPYRPSRGDAVGERPPVYTLAGPGSATPSPGGTRAKRALAGPRSS